MGQAIEATGRAGTEVQQYLTFQLGGELYAMGIRNVKEIIEYGHLTEIPLVPAFIRGVINLRGAVVPVIDLAVRFGRPSTAVARRTCIVIVEIDGDNGCQDIGVVVDAVSEVLEVGPADIEPPPSFGSHIRADFIHGMARIAGKLVIILAIEKVLSDDELAALGSVSQPHAVANSAITIS